MKSLRLLLPDGELAAVTPRCLTDYMEQVRPALADEAAAWRDLQRLVTLHGEVSLERPAWMVPRSEDAEEWTGAPRWVVCGDVAVLVQYAANDPDRLLACAVVTRGSVSREVRRIKSEHAQGRRKYRMARRREPGKARSKWRRERRDRIARETDSRRDEA